MDWLFSVPYIGPLVFATCSLNLHFLLFFRTNYIAMFASLGTQENRKAKNQPVHFNEHYSILIIVFVLTGEIGSPENVSNKCFTTRWLGASCSSSACEIAHSKTSECYLQAWAWARRAGSARKASGLAADGGGEPRAPHLG
jgi:hypothetical protein